jgi:hypothetical protein
MENNVLVNHGAINAALGSFKQGKPFFHCLVNNFFNKDIARNLEIEFPNYDSNEWHLYKNSLENKKTINSWNLFPNLTYSVFSYLNSQQFVNFLSERTGIELCSDPGLHGGGWHIHGIGGNLNPHLDYSIHPKLGKERRLNLIIYLSENLENSIHGGELGLWSAREDGECGILEKIIPTKFNSAVIFDTTQNSWHGMANKLTVPFGIYRKSIAVYYLTKPSSIASTRTRAYFAPREDQLGDDSVEYQIRMRSDEKMHGEVYVTDES